jgi:hypothetical protein
VRLQQQVEDLRKHWQKTHEQEHAEYEKQLQRKEQRNQELQMQIGSDHTFVAAFHVARFSIKQKTNQGEHQCNLEMCTRFGPSACYLLPVLSSGTTYLPAACQH